MQIGKAPQPRLNDRPPHVLHCVERVLTGGCDTVEDNVIDAEVQFFAIDLRRDADDVGQRKIELDGQVRHAFAQRSEKNQSIVGENEVPLHLVFVDVRVEGSPEVGVNFALVGRSEHSDPRWNRPHEGRQ